VVLAFVAVASVSACGYQAGSGLCEETILEVDPIVVRASQKPVTLVATLTTKKGARPVVGAEISFFNHTLPPWAPDQPTGRGVGVATTGADGRAELVEGAGVDGLVHISGEVLIGYGAELRQITDIGGEFYCHSRGTAPITIEG
jgi:hypothetical protein